MGITTMTNNDSNHNTNPGNDLNGNTTGKMDSCIQAQEIQVTPAQS